MKTTIMKLVGSVALLAFTVSARAEVIYLQNFGNNGTNNDTLAHWNTTVTGADYKPWYGLYAGFANSPDNDVMDGNNIGNNFGIPNAADRGTTGLTNKGDAAGTTTSSAAGWFYGNARMAFLYTEVPVIPAAGYKIDTLKFLWDEGDATGTKVRASVKIGSQWYVSSDKNVATDNGYVLAQNSFDFFDTNWYAFTANIGSPFVVGSIALTGVDLLASGNIAGFGVYKYDSGAMRLDNFAVDATFVVIPEPTTAVLLAVGAGILAVCYRRRKA